SKGATAATRRPEPARRYRCDADCFAIACFNASRSLSSGARARPCAASRCAPSMSPVARAVRIRVELKDALEGGARVQRASGTERGLSAPEPGVDALFVDGDHLVG